MQVYSQELLMLYQMSFPPKKNCLAYIMIQTALAAFQLLSIFPVQGFFLLLQ